MLNKKLTQDLFRETDLHFFEIVDEFRLILKPVSEEGMLDS